MKQEPSSDKTQEQFHREQWRKHRAKQEQKDLLSWRRGTDGRWIKKYKHHAILIFGTLLKVTGFYKYGLETARNIQIRRVHISLKTLPEAFKGYRILHLSDLHLDCMDGFGDIIAQTVSSLPCDLCVITGDFRCARHGEYKQILPPLRKVLNAVSTIDGIYSVLGNHDTQAMTDDFEKMGIRLLTNQTAALTRKGQQILVTGVDDPHDYYTAAAAACLKLSGNDFKIFLAHTPEMYRQVSDAGFSLYLCGHTHGGQICLPGAIPLMTCLDTGKRFYRGLWRFQNLIGHTSPGCGTAKIPIRFNSQPEITVLTLD